MIRTLLFTLMLAAGAAEAQPQPDGRAGPPPAARTPSPEALASVPGLDAAQQIEVRRILIQRRDAHDALHAKEIADRETQLARFRTEHERVDDDSSQRLRKLLGEDGYRTFAEWLAPETRGNGPMRPPMRRGAQDPAHSVGSLDPAASAPLAPDTDDADQHARVR
jgi:hypothetical protein